MPSEPRPDATPEQILNVANRLRQAWPPNQGTQSPPTRTRAATIEDDIETAMLLESFATLKEQQTWQPMETAPKDGTEIIGFRDGAMVLIWYCGPAHSAGKFEWSYSDAPAYFEPTHWMPLPSPPAPPAQDGGLT